MAGETQEQLEAMPVEQLEQLVSQDGVIEAPHNGEATSNNGGESVGSQQNAQEAQPAEAVPKYFKDFADNMKRELNGYRSLQGLGDKLPKLIEQQLEQRLAKLQQAQQNANLSPEDQQAQAQLQGQQEALDKYIQDKANAQFETRAKDYLPVLNELIEQRQQKGLQDSAFSMVKDIIPENQSELWETVFENLTKDIESGKPGAIERFDRLSANPSEIALAMIQAQRQQTNTQANQVTQQRSTAAKQAAQGIRTSSVPTSGKKNVAEMSEKELDGMSIADLEAAIPEL